MEVVDCKTVDEAVTALRQPSTRWIVANGRKFGDAGARKIARALRSNTTLKELSLAGNNIGPDGAAALGAAVGQHPRLRELYLHKNKLGQRGVEKLAHAIQFAGGAPALQLLSLGKNGIGPRLPFNLITASLRTLNLTNNNLSELPSRLAQCPQLEELLLEGNPLVSPPIELYERSGWSTTRKFLEATQDVEREENLRNGFGRVTHDERDDMLLLPARNALYEGRLGEALSLVHRARELLCVVGLSGKHAVARADELASKIALLAACEGASPPSPLDCMLLVNERRFLASKEVIARSSKLMSLLTSEADDGVVGGAGSADLRFEDTRRLHARIDGTTTLGFKCFISHLATDDLELSVRVCLREHADALKEEKGTASGDSADSDTDSEDEISAQGMPAPGPAPFVNSPVMTVDKLGYLTREWQMPLVSSGGALVNELPVAVHVLLEAILLAKRFDVPNTCDEALEMLWNVLKPSIAVRTLMAAHLAREQSVKDVCLHFLCECCNHIEREDWALLQDHGELLVEVLDVLGGREKVAPIDQVKTLLLLNIMKRLDAAEARAERAEMRLAKYTACTHCSNASPSRRGKAGEDFNVCVKAGDQV